VKRQKRRSFAQEESELGQLSTRPREEGISRLLQHTNVSYLTSLKDRAAGRVDLQELNSTDQWEGEEGEEEGHSNLEGLREVPRD